MFYAGDALHKQEHGFFGTRGADPGGAGGAAAPPILILVVQTYHFAPPIIPVHK